MHKFVYYLSIARLWNIVDLGLQVGSSHNIVQMKWIFQIKRERVWATLWTRPKRLTYIQEMNEENKQN